MASSPLAALPVAGSSIVRSIILVLSVMAPSASLPVLTKKYMPEKDTISVAHQQHDRGPLPTKVLLQPSSKSSNFTSKPVKETRCRSSKVPSSTRTKVIPLTMETMGKSSLRFASANPGCTFTTSLFENFLPWTRLNATSDRPLRVGTSTHTLCGMVAFAVLLAALY